MADGCYKEFIIESINFIRNKDKKPTTESIFNYVKTKTGVCDLDLLKSSLETLLDDKIIENRPSKNNKSGESYCIVDNENTDKNSDSKTESETSNLDSKANEPSTPINISSDKCVCSCHKETEHLKSEIFSIKTFLKKEMELLQENEMLAKLHSCNLIFGISPRFRLFIFDVNQGNEKAG